MGKSEWRAQSSGPDLMDVIPLLRAMETLHSVSVAIIVSPAGTGFATSAQVTVSALAETVPESSRPGGIQVMSEYPNPQGTSLWGEVYRLCWLLDEQLSKTWKQGSLME